MAIKVVISPQLFPFGVLVAPPPLFAVSENVQVRVKFTAISIGPDVVAEFDGFVDAFCMLASSGGLSGNLIPPQDSTITEKGDPLVEQNVLSWNLLDCRIDERAVLPLLNLLWFEHGRHSITKVEIANTKSVARPLEVRVGIEDYYPSMAPLPFSFKINHPISESLLLSLSLKHAPSVEQVAAIETELLAWSVAPALGAFAVPELGPEASGMVPDQSVEVFDNEIVWSVDRFRMHPAAIDSLVNCCATLFHQVSTITSVEVS